MSKKNKPKKKKPEFTRQQLYYYRKIGLIKNLKKGPNGYINYDIRERTTLKVIWALKESGISTQRIRKSYEGIKRQFNSIENPFAEKQILVFGGNVIFIHRGIAYDAITRQSILIKLDEVERWSGEIINVPFGLTRPSKDKIARFTRKARFRVN
ncbi:MAG: hypothetical protein JRD68_02490 [Deltaproteobacteria bacterium]|nr:hypothetical protein [Deltaproteobacteria bacterium]